MKCPECVKEGERSRVDRGSMFSTCMGGQEDYWDEDGRHHYHDPNSTTTEFSCSRCHHWQEKRWKGCAACGREDHVEVQTFSDGTGYRLGKALSFVGSGDTVTITVGPKPASYVTTSYSDV